MHHGRIAEGVPCDHGAVRGQCKLWGEYLKHADTGSQCGGAGGDYLFDAGLMKAKRLIVQNHDSMCGIALTNPPCNSVSLREPYYAGVRGYSCPAFLSISVFETMLFCANGWVLGLTQHG